MRQRGSLVGACVALGFVLSVHGCVGDSSTPVDSGADQTAGDTGQNDTSTDTASDAPVDAGTTYGDMTDKNRWTTTDINGVVGGARFTGAVLAGKYIYYVPTSGSTTSNLVRYDTTQAFTAANFEKFDLSQVSTTTGWAGGIFDGKYLYLMPFHNPTVHGVFVRYDTTQAFNTAASYQKFDLATVSTSAVEFTGGAFDGKYVYLAPAVNGLPVRFDKAALFDAGASYETHTLSLVERYVAAAYDGAKYIYFGPHWNTGGSGSYSGALEQFDTTATFTGVAQSTGWTSYDLGANVDAKAVGFGGAIFDGRYLYLVPFGFSLSVRYDTQAAFNTATSYSKFDLSMINAGAFGYAGGTFDGRYIYFAPNGNTGSTPEHGLAMRYDTTAAFSSSNAWQSFDLTTKDTNAKGFSGAAFDGRYVYFAPLGHSIAARFDARSPSGFPAVTASFY